MMLWLLKRLTALLPPERKRVIRRGGEPYLTRWYLYGLPRRADGGLRFDYVGRPKDGNEDDAPFGIYLHEFHRSDVEQELHNHPWRWACSLLLVGGYREELRVGEEVVKRNLFAGDINVLKSDTFHRIELHGWRRQSCWSLFVAGPKISTWGFWDRETGEYYPWREFLKR
jgi:hypothetical protein